MNAGMAMPVGDANRVRVGPLRILVVTPEPPAPDARGGRPQATAATLAALAGRHQVTLVTQAGGDPADDRALDRWIRSGIGVRVAWWPRPKGLRRFVRRIDLASRWLLGRDPWTNVLYADPDIQAALDDILAARSFDVILVEDNVMAAYHFAAPVAKVLTEHEVRRPRAPHWRAALRRDGLVGLLRELDWQRWPAYQRRVWPRFDAVQVFTPADAAVAASLAPVLGNRLHLNPLGIEIPDDWDTEGHGLERRPLVFVGAMSHAPNVDAAEWLAREVLPAVRERRPDATLTIVGQSPPASVRALRSETVEVTGTVLAVEPFLAAADVVVAPVRIGGGLRTKVLQAMAMAKPVITTTRGAEGIDLGSDPPLVVADTTQAIADAAAALLGDERRRQELGARARAYVLERHSPRAYGARLDAVLAEVARPTAAP